MERIYNYLDNVVHMGKYTYIIKAIQPPKKQCNWRHLLNIKDYNSVKI